MRCSCGEPATHVTSDECASLEPLRDLRTGRFKKDPKKSRRKRMYHTYSCAAHACSKCVALGV